MNSYKKFITLNIILMLCSCGTIKEGFTNQKKNSSDEFLVEKKSPLIMPPDYNELPIPKEINNQDETEEISIKTIIISDEGGLTNSDAQNEINKGVEKSLLEKIKKN